MVTETAIANDQILKELIQKADFAKTLSSEITLLSEYSDEVQRKHVRIREPYDRRDEFNYPEDWKFWSLLDLGRLQRISDLQKQLSDLLSPQTGEQRQLPPPIQIAFGSGQICVRKCRNQDGLHGIMFEDSGVCHPVGADANKPEEPAHEPQPGEIYLWFTNVESAEVVSDTLQEVIERMSGTESK